MCGGGRCRTVTARWIPMLGFSYLTSLFLAELRRWSFRSCSSCNLLKATIPMPPVLGPRLQPCRAQRTLSAGVHAASLAGEGLRPVVRVRGRTHVPDSQVSCRGSGTSSLPRRTACSGLCSCTAPCSRQALALAPDGHGPTAPAVPSASPSQQIALPRLLATHLRRNASSRSRCMFAASVIDSEEEELATSGSLGVAVLNPSFLCY